MSKIRLVIIILICTNFSTFGQLITPIKKAKYDVKLEFLDEATFEAEWLGRRWLQSPCNKKIRLKLKLTNVGSEEVYYIPIGGNYYVNGSFVEKLKVSESIRFISSTGIVYFESYNNPDVPQSTPENYRVPHLRPGESKIFTVDAPFEPSPSENLKVDNSYYFYLAGRMYRYESTFFAGQNYYPEFDGRDYNNQPIKTYFDVCPNPGNSITWTHDPKPKESDYRLFSSANGQNSLVNGEKGKNSLKSSIRVFPIPANQGSRIKVETGPVDLTGNISVEIKDRNGDPVSNIAFEKTSPNTMEIETSNLRPGLYILVIRKEGQEPVAETLYIQ